MEDEVIDLIRSTSDPARAVSIAIEVFLQLLEQNEASQLQIAAARVESA